MRVLFEPKKSPSPALRKVLKKFCYCLKHYDDPKEDIAYWYGESALTGLLASTTRMVRDDWSLEEFTGQRRKGRRKNASGKGDLWLGVETKNEGQVLQSNMSRRVAESWFIWFLRSVSFVWFDERERQDSPAHQIDCV